MLMLLPVAKPVAGLPGAHFALLRLQQPLELDLLHPEERQLWDHLESESRRREWWAGRIAAKSALTALGAGGAWISSDDRGVPKPLGPGTEGLLVSITHGRRWSAALAARRDESSYGIGIDLVEAEDMVRLRKLERRVLAPGELDDIEDRNLGLAAAWAAREAVAKATSTGMWAFAMSRVNLVRLEALGERLEVALAGVRLSKLRLDDDTLIVFAAAERALVEQARAIALR